MLIFFFKKNTFITKIAQYLQKKIFDNNIMDTDTHFCDFFLHIKHLVSGYIFVWQTE